MTEYEVLNRKLSCGVVAEIGQIRTFWPCGDTGNCDWVEETTESLQIGRWYASNQQLPDGTQAVVGGRNAFTIEYVPANGRGQFNLQLLIDVSNPLTVPSY